jgi:PAS domain S-box-containing protein
VDSEQLRQLTESLMEHLPLGVVLTDLSGEMMYVNQTAEDIRRVHREQLLGRNVLDCHSPKSQAGVARAIENIVRKPETVYKRMVEDSVNGKFYLNTYAGVVDHENRAVGLAVLTEDVTDKRKLEMERAAAFQMMEETTNNVRRQYHDHLITSLESIAKLLRRGIPIPATIRATSATSR